MNKAFYDALKSGGELVVGDYSAKPGAGTSVVQTLHRSDEARSLWLNTLAAHGHNTAALLAASHRRAPPQVRRRAGSATAGAFRGSVRLAEFQHVDIDRLRRGMRVGVSSISGNVEEIAVVDQFEPRRLDLRGDQRVARQDAPSSP